MTDPAAALSHSGFLLALASEIDARLGELMEAGTSSSIDLRSLPMDPDTRAALLTFLGDGEVSATIASSGRSEITETRFTGVWRIAHYDAHDALLMEEIAITAVPDILRADPADLSRARAELGALLQDDIKEGQANA